MTRALRINGTDIADFVPELPPQVVEEADGRVPDFGVFVRGYIIKNGQQNLTTTLPGGLDVGQDILYHDGGTVYFAGKTQKCEDDPTGSGPYDSQVTASGYTEELNKHIGYISFGTGTIVYGGETFDLSRDTHRVRYLMALYLPTWDHTTYIPDAAYVTYNTSRGYYKTTVLKVLQDIASYQGIDPNVPQGSRFWQTWADWTLGITTKYLSYFSRTSGAGASSYNLTSGISTATAVSYYDLNTKRVRDRQRLINSLAVAGPAGEPMDVSYLASSLVNVTAQGNSLTKSGGSGGSWDAGAFGEQSITTEGGYCEAVMSLKTEAFGFSTTNASASWDTIRFGVRGTYTAGTTGQLDAVYQGTVLQANIGQYPAGARVRVEIVRNQDAVGVFWQGYVYMDTGSGLVLLYGVRFTASQIDDGTHGGTNRFPMYVDTSLNSSVATLNTMIIRRHSYSVFQRADSVALYGELWADDILRDDNLDTVEKRLRTAERVFDRRAYPRVTFVVTTLGMKTDGSRYQFRAGKSVQVSESKFGWNPQTLLIQRVTTDWSSAADPDWPEQILELGDRLIADEEDDFGYLLRIPTSGESTPPNAPVISACTPLNADGTFGRYDGGLDKVNLYANWEGSTSTNIVSQKVNFTLNGVRNSITVGATDRQALLVVDPNTAFSITVQATDSAGRTSDPSAAATGTTARSPQNAVFNGSMEIGSDDPNILGGWALTLAGSSTVTRSAAQAFDMTYSALLHRVASANCKMTSRRIAADYTKTYTLVYHTYGAGGSYCQCEVLEYGAGDTPASTGTQTFTDAVTPSWTEVRRTLTFPLNTTQIELRFSNIFAGSADLYIDGVSLQRQIVNDDVAEHALSPAKIQRIIHKDLYNPDFSIPSSTDPTVADGWTFTGTNGATGRRVLASSVGASVAGDYVFEINTTAAAGSLGSLVSDRFSMVDTTGTSFLVTYSKYYRMVYETFAAFGTYALYADWYDASGSLITTFTVGSGTLAVGNALVDNFNSSSGIVSGSLRIEILGDGLNANSTWIGGCHVGEAVTQNMLKSSVVSSAKIATNAVTSAKIAAGAVTAGKIGTGGISAAAQFAAGVVDTAALGAGAVTNAKLGTITDTSKFHFDAMTGPLTFYDDLGTARGSIAVDRTLNFMRIQADPTAVSELRLNTLHSSIIVHDDATSSNRYIQYQSGTTDAPHKFLGGGLVAHNDAALGTTDTKGFFHAPYMAGVPSGLPVLYTGGVPMVWDDTNLQLYIYSRSAAAWKKSAVFT